MVRAILILMALLLVPPSIPADAGKKHRKRQDRVVVVRDSTPDVWKPYVAEAVAMFNLMLPKRAPRMLYQAVPEARCTYPKKRRAIDVCVDIDNPFLAYSTPGRLRAGTGIVALSTPTPDVSSDIVSPRQILCHEFMHLTTGIPDDYSMPQRETSCVHGILAEPGPFDIAYAQKVYKKRRHR